MIFILSVITTIGSGLFFLNELVTQSTNIITIIASWLVLIAGLGGMLWLIADWFSEDMKHWVRVILILIWAILFGITGKQMNNVVQENQVISNSIEQEQISCSFFTVTTSKLNDIISQMTENLESREMK